jgi:hypothetical protein
MANLNFELLKWQQKVITAPARFKVVAAGRRCGKSRFAAVNLLIRALQCPKGSSTMYVAPTLGAARTIMWDLLLDLGREVIKSAHVNNMEITLVNERKILVRGADNPDALRGVSLFYLVMDEVAYIKADIWEKVLRAALSDKQGDALFISTPDGRGHFYDWFKLGQEETDPEWRSWHFTTYDNETIPPTEIEAAKRTLSSFAFKQEYMASFDSSGSGIFKEEWFKYGPEPSDGDYFIAFDLAGFSDVVAANTAAKKRLDQSAIAVVKVAPDGSWWVRKIESGRWNVQDTAQRILKNVREFRPSQVGCEKGMAKNAVMPYLSDLMRQSNTYFQVQDLTHGNKKKADRITWALQGRLEHGRITLNENEKWDELVDEATLFGSKDVHDDLIDALSYVDQMSVVTYNTDYEEDDWEPLDPWSAY